MGVSFPHLGIWLFFPFLFLSEVKLPVIVMRAAAGWYLGSDEDVLQLQFYFIVFPI